MKNAQTIYILIMLFFLCFNEVNAQQQTAYQKKILEIEKRYVKKILVADGKWTQRSEAEIFYANADYLGTLLAFGLITSPQYIEGFKRELKQAEKLKTAVDFKREREVKVKKELEVNLAKTKEGEEEKNRKLQEQQESYERTDLGIIKKSIKNAFEIWNQKGEFEKEVDYEERLKNKSKEAFSQICLEQIKRKIENFSYNHYLEKELSLYNSEKELFTITFKFNEAEWQNNINIPIAKAQEFKNNWDDLKFEINEYDWCFVNNSLCPTLVVFNSGDEKFEFPLSLKNQLDISYSSDNLGINNPHLKNVFFKYSEAKSINALNYEKYNERMDSIFNEYNRQLTQNPYNFEKIILTSNYKIKNEGNLENNFNSSVDSIKLDFKNLNEEIELKKLEIESKPVFPGGMEKLNSFLIENYKKPNVEGLKGKVFVSFVVEKDGSLTDIKIIRDIGYGTGAEAIRVLKKSPKWNPALLNGEKVKSSFMLPISVETNRADMQ